MKLRDLHASLVTMAKATIQKCQTLNTDRILRRNDTPKKFDVDQGRVCTAIN
jgi:hypothetical protein